MALPPLPLRARAKQIINEFDSFLYEVIRDFSKVVTYSTFLSAGVFPIIAATLSLAKQTLPDAMILLVLALWLPTSFITIYSTFKTRSLLSKVTLEEVHLIRENLAAEVDRNKSRLARMVAQQAAIQLSLRSLRDVINRSEAKDLVEDLEDLLHPLVKARLTALEYEDHEDTKYNFVVYRYDAQSNLMKLVWRDKSPSFRAQNRPWPLDKGHPGLTYRLEGSWIVEDAKIEPNPNLFTEEDKARDIELYRSFMSVPVGRYTLNENANITFTVTSDKAHQFSKEEYEHICNIYRSILSIYFLVYPQQLTAFTHTPDYK